MKVLGREREQGLLQEAFDSKKAELIALYGRRRVGKTYLIKNFFESKSCTFIFVSGMKGGSMREQLNNFADGLRKAFIPGLKTPQNWREAFTLFNEVIEKIADPEKVVLFLDELPWLATRRSGLLEALDYFWNRYWSHNPRIKVVICGSAASWMLNKIIYNKGGLYNRVTCQFRLEPFMLKETKEYLKANGIKLPNRQIVEVYMATGGIAFYLSKIRKDLSAAQNIDELAFNKQGILYQDFDILFSSLFDEADDYIKLVRAIAMHRYGILQEELLREANLSSGGSAKEKLRDLEEAGFIISSLIPGHRKRGIYYRLIDEYAYFYLKWIEPFKKSAKKYDKTSWLDLRLTSSWKSWAGYAFEMLCMKHIVEIRKSLNLDSLARASSWSYKGDDKDQEGVQIDLLFDRPDDSITMCEIKYTEEPFNIDKEYHKKIKNKIEVYKKVTKTKKHIFFAFISASALRKTVYSEEDVNSVVTIDELFK